MTEQERFFFDHGYAQAKREFDKTIEDIKAEIENISEETYISDGVTSYGIRKKTAKECKNDVLAIIDKHIGKENK